MYKRFMKYVFLHSFIRLRLLQNNNYIKTNYIRTPYVTIRLLCIPTKLPIKPKIKFCNFLGMPKFSLRKNTSYSAKSDEEMEINQDDSVQQLRMEASQACNSLAEGVEQLSNETSQACSNIVSGVNQGFVSKDDLQCYHQEVMKQFQSYKHFNNEILNSLESLKKATLYFKHELNQKERLYPTAMASTNEQPIPVATTSVPQPTFDDNASTTIRLIILQRILKYTLKMVF
ncbi:hypothetical protein BCR32DRAFT_272663 [Anaeromyces robustus]|uniref:Uncharacterized protein n=1 Tax=Anaeromyces robustus TaxID=1754192 RepID=A0A1Y1VXW4_9FUNG|nr:hypothetical protein BCR32DRAFT_272663 [Anaeromyces robustus]|eukprot:ORX66097.1 hypothetical protein BCR32DRAFT_272663 [Anaeromyces robustus]